jgi:hypothetical protein
MADTPPLNETAESATFNNPWGKVWQIQKERESFFDQLLTASRKMGELKTRLLQLVTSAEKPHAEAKIYELSVFCSERSG